MTNNKRKAKRGECLDFIKTICQDPPSDQCVIWPFSKIATGHGNMYFDGKTRSAHRVALILFTGIDPKDMDAAHGPCHNPSCVNPHPDHGIRWATRSENTMDRVRDGTHQMGSRNHQAKLSTDDVIAIRASEGTHKNIAKQFNISSSQVGNIKNRIKWAHIN